MSRISKGTRKKVVCEHIQDGRTINSLAAKYGVAHAMILNWGGILCKGNRLVAY